MSGWPWDGMRSLGEEDRRVSDATTCTVRNPDAGTIAQLSESARYALAVCLASEPRARRRRHRSLQRQSSLRLEAGNSRPIPVFVQRLTGLVGLAFRQRCIAQGRFRFSE